MLAEPLPASIVAGSIPPPTTTLRATVVGAGYVGLVSGACLARLGHQVTVVEADQRRLHALRDGFIPIREADLDDLIANEVEAGRLRFTNALGPAAIDADVVVIAVGTPSAAGGGVDLTAVETVVQHVALASPNALVVLKSSVPPGTARRMELLAHSMGASGVRVVSNPEFLREGCAVRDFMAPDRIVIGTRDDDDADIVARLYAGIDAPTYWCLPEEAELAKYAANSMLAVRISFMNEMSAIADHVGADVTTVASIVGSDARIGPAFLGAGLGWGGSCLPKDVQGLASVAADLGLSSPMLNATITANQRQRSRALYTVLGALEGIDRPRVAILGLSFKPNTDDIRESPALWLASALADHGVLVRATDPWALANAERAARRITYTLGAMTAVEDADVTVLATEWTDYLALDWAEVARRMRGTTVLDARNALDVHAVTEAGLTYRSLGRNVAAAATKDIACAS